MLLATSVREKVDALGDVSGTHTNQDVAKGFAVRNEIGDKYKAVWHLGWQRFRFLARSTLKIGKTERMFNDQFY